MQRRSFMIGATALAAASGLIRPAHAQGRPFTFTSWGGALSDAERNAFIDPFAAMKGIEAINTSPTETAKTIAMVEAKKVEWDLVCEGGTVAFQGEQMGFLEVLDLSKIPNAAALPDAMKAPCGLVTSTGATIIAWSESAFPDGGPQTWAEFWDVARFPGPRGLYTEFTYNYEAALLAAGLKAEEIYPATPEKIEMAFGKIREIKPHVTVWWGSGAQPPQLLSTGELAASSAWSGRMLAAKAEGAPVGFTFRDGVAWGNWWVIPKGSPYVDLAHEAINFALEVENQKKLLPLGTYGPVVSAATEGLSPEEMEILVMAPQNLEHMVLLNEKEGWGYTEATLGSWQQLMME